MAVWRKKSGVVTCLRILTPTATANAHPRPPRATLGGPRSRNTRAARGRAKNRRKPKCTHISPLFSVLYTRLRHNVPTLRGHQRTESKTDGVFSPVPFCTGARLCGCAVRCLPPLPHTHHTHPTADRPPTARIEPSLHPERAPTRPPPPAPPPPRPPPPPPPPRIRTAAPMQENRRAGRHRTYRFALSVFSAVSRPCRVVSLSESRYALCLFWHISS